MAEIETVVGDCLAVLDTLPESKFDLIYLDPPFFTQKEHALTTRDGSATFAFRDLWASHEEYARFLHERLVSLRRVLARTGSLFFHWDILYLNPKAKERVGYPTQKPVLLLEQIIRLCTEEGDWILDPFCGSGTTLVAAKLLERNAVGIDSSQEAIALTESRLKQPFKTESHLLKKGREEYARKDTDVLAYLHGLDCHMVQRNGGMDAILKQEIDGKPVFLRVQRPGEKLHEAATASCSTATTKGNAHLVLIVTEDNELPFGFEPPQGVTLIRSTALRMKDTLRHTLNFK